MTRRIAAFAAVFAGVGVLWAAPYAGVAAAADREQAVTNQAPLGGDLFKMYCASCHGTNATGDGPLASAMRRKPPNLTEIAKRQKGVYPSDLVFKIIDGRQRVTGHGGPDMPVWGDAFTRTSDAPNEESVRARIKALVDYLESIQARDTQ
jgi:mono/diheme cytochrome c family protein